MALIDEIIFDNFPDASTGLTHDELVRELDLGIFHTGKMIQTVFDLVVHPEGGEVDTESVVAAVLSLLAFVGRLGFLVDALECMPELERITSPMGNA